MIHPDTPVIIGVGQSNDRIDSPDYHAWSASDLAAAAARSAIADTQATGDLLRAIDAIGTTRTFEDSRPFPAEFGKSSCFPRSITQRLGIDPAYALWTKAGGNSPQDLVTEFSERIAAGEFKLVLVTGAEAISTVRFAKSQGRQLDFTEEPSGSVEDRGPGIKDFADPLAREHGVITAPLGYALAETARRVRLGLSRDAYAKQMGELFAPFASIAHDNPNSAWAVPAYSADELVTVGAQNRWIANPYPLRLVARDQVNLGAAIVIASVATARALGVPESRFVYLHGWSKAMEKRLLLRPDLSTSPASRAVVKAALDMADTSVDQIAKFDFYSCFPIAVSNVACDELGMSADDPRKLTVTGGLPFFGGPGNNYSMHAIAEIVPMLRAAPGSKGFIGANGGHLSKYSAGVYSTTPRAWRSADNETLQQHLDAVPPVELLETFEGEGTIETYTISHVKGVASYAIVVGRTSSGARFISRNDSVDQALLQALQVEDGVGRRVRVSTQEGINRFVMQA